MISHDLLFCIVSFFPVHSHNTAQEDHALIMAKFAHNCLQKTRSLMNGKLSDSLGVECRDLELRIGIHSGPVTGGVLRGQKSRFQLFGDTMNTTSRLESTGMPGKIQVSETTAEALRSRGKAHWLQKRSGTVQAKGKGEMETYWLNLHGPGSGNNKSEDQMSHRSESYPPRESALPYSAAGGGGGQDWTLFSYESNTAAVEAAILSQRMSLVRPARSTTSSVTSDVPNLASVSPGTSPHILLASASIVIPIIPCKGAS